MLRALLAGMLSPSQARLASSSLSAALANAEATVDEALRGYRGAPVVVDLTGYGARVVEEIEAMATMAGWCVQRDGPILDSESVSHRSERTL